MSRRRIVLRCPFCETRFETFSVDNFHVEGRVEKPSKDDYVGDIIEKIEDCRNPKCLRPITVYWYEPKRDFRKA
jgi:hypothetical protein